MPLDRFIDEIYLSDPHGVYPVRDDGQIIGIVPVRDVIEPLAVPVTSADRARRATEPASPSEERR